MAGKKTSWRRYSTKEIIDALQSTNGLVSLAARRLNCSPEIIYRRMRKDPSVADAVRSAREELVDLAEMQLRSAVLSGKPWAVTLVLKTLGRHRGYVERFEAVHEESAGFDIKFVDYRDALDVFEREN